MALVADGEPSPAGRGVEQDAAIPNGARRFHAGLAGPKDILWTQGTQFDFYDTEPQVTVAVDAVAAHFTRTL